MKVCGTVCTVVVPVVVSSLRFLSLSLSLKNPPIITLGSGWFGFPTSSGCSALRFSSHSHFAAVSLVAAQPSSLLGARRERLFVDHRRPPTTGWAVLLGRCLCRSSGKTSGRGALASLSSLACSNKTALLFLCVRSFAKSETFCRPDGLPRDLVRTGNRCASNVDNTPHVRLWLSTRARALRSLPGAERVRLLQ